MAEWEVRALLRVMNIGMEDFDPHAKRTRPRSLRQAYKEGMLLPLHDPTALGETVRELTGCEVSDKQLRKMRKEVLRRLKEPRELLEKYSRRLDFRWWECTQWTPEDVYRFAEKQGVSGEPFLEAEINGEELLSLTEKRLFNELQITSSIARCRFLYHCAVLRGMSQWDAVYGKELTLCSSPRQQRQYCRDRGKYKQRQREESDGSASEDSDDSQRRWRRKCERQRVPNNQDEYEHNNDGHVAVTALEQQQEQREKKLSPLAALWRQHEEREQAAIARGAVATAAMVALSAAQTAAVRVGASAAMVADAAEKAASLARQATEDDAVSSLRALSMSTPQYKSPAANCEFDLHFGTNDDEGRDKQADGTGTQTAGDQHKDQQTGRHLVHRKQAVPQLSLRSSSSSLQPPCSLPQPTASDSGNSGGGDNAQPTEAADASEADAFRLSPEPEQQDQDQDQVAIASPAHPAAAKGVAAGLG